MTVLSPHTARPAQGRFGPFVAAPDGALWGADADFPLPQLERLAQACLRSPEAALLVVDAWRASHDDLERIYLRGIAPCARLLGQWWVDDVADFGQVTIASAHLQQLLYRLSQEFCAPGADCPCGLSLLLATEPQSQHTMGAFMLGEFFRRRGWSVHLLVPQDGNEVLHLLRREWFDALGLSVSTGRQWAALSQLLASVRAEAPNPGLSVLVGGPLAQSDPAAVQALGADWVGGDARATVDTFSHLVIGRRN